MRFLSLCGVLLLTTWLAAAEPLAQWEFGTGMIAGEPAKVGAEILPNVQVTAGPEIIRLSLSKAPQSLIMMSPGSKIRLIENDNSLEIFVDEGVIQGNIANKGPYVDMHIFGAAIDVRITGTLFVVERVKADTDYIALVEGRVEVNVRKDVAKALNDEEKKGVELNAREGIGGSISGGLTRVDALTSRPQLPSSSARGAGVREDAMDGSGDWAEDNAIADTTDEAMNDSMVDELASEISEQISDQITEDITIQVTNEVVLEIIGGGAGADGELGSPPGPPQ